MKADIIQLKSGSGKKEYPVTSSAAVGMSDGSGSLDDKLKNITIGSGATFIPKVDQETGIISWTNDKGLVNPEEVNIKGPKGDPGLKVWKGTKENYDLIPIKDPNTLYIIIN